MNMIHLALPIKKVKPKRGKYSNLYFYVMKKYDHYYDAYVFGFGRAIIYTSDVL